MGATGSDNLEGLEYTYKNNLPISDENEIYLEMFKQHLANGVQVIGLIGDYGTGKSSIIEKFTASYKSGYFKKKNKKSKTNPEVIIVKIPKFGKETQNTSGEVRKYLTHQLLSSVKNLGIKSKELEAIKKKIYAHGNRAVTGWEILLILLFVIFLILAFTDFGKQILSSDAEMVESFWGISALFFTYVGYKLLNIFKLQNYSLISSSQFKFERNKKESYLDYDLDTLTTIINLIKENTDDLAIIIEDIDRYNNINILTELSQIIKNTPNVNYILPVKHDLFENQIEIPKFFDATINVLPINDNLFLYEYIEKTLQENKVEVDVKLISLTTPFIKDIRIFNTIFNKYISLILNYKNLQPDLAKEQLNQIYTVAVLTILYPDIVRYQSDTKNVFYDYINEVADITNLRKNVLNDLQSKCETKKSKLAELIKELENREKEYELEINESSEKIQELINQIIINGTKNSHSYINWAGERIYAYQIQGKLESGYVPTLEDLNKVKNYINVDLSWLLQLFEKNEMRQNNLSTFEKDVIEKQNECDSIRQSYEARVKEVRDMSYYHLAKIVKAEYFTCKVYDNLKSEENLKFANNKEAVLGLVIELVKNEYITQNWYRYLSVIDKNADVAQRRKFKYQIISENTRYNFNEEEPLVVTRELINTFEIETFSERKFLNKYIVKYLFENIGVDNNSDKLLTIIKSGEKREPGLYNKINNELNKSFKIKESDLSNGYTSILKLYESSLESKYLEFKNEEFPNINGYGKMFNQVNELASIYYKNGVTPPNAIIEIFAASITDYLSKLSEETNISVENIKVIIAFVEYGYKSINEKLFGEFFSALTMYNYSGVKPKLFGVMSNLPKLYKPLMDNNNAKVGHSPERYIIGTELFEYNEKNLDFIINELHMQERIIYSQELRRYLASDIKIKYKSLVSEIMEKQKPYVFEEVEEFIKMAQDYEVVFLDLTSKYKEYLEEIIQNNLFEPNEKNCLVLLNENALDKIAEMYKLDEEYISDDEYKQIFESINETTDPSTLTNFAKKARKISLLDENTSALLLEVLIGENKVEVTRANFDIIKKISKNLLPNYILQFKFDDFQLLNEEDITEYEVFNVIARGDFTLENKLEFYEEYHGIIKTNISLKYPIEINIKLINNQKSDSFSKYNSKLSDDDKIKLRQGMLKESVETFYYYYKNIMTYEELSNNKIKEYITDNFEKSEQLKILLTSNVSKKQLHALIEMYRFKTDVQFTPSGRGSKTKNIPEYLKENLEVLNLLQEKQIIKEYKNEKLINF